MIDSVIFVTSLIGLAALMLSMPAHQRSWLGSTLAPVQGRRLRWLGFLLLPLQLVMAVADSGWGVGLTAWFGWQTLAGILIVAANALHGREKGIRK